MVINTFRASFKHSVILRTLIGFSLIIGFNLLSMLVSMYLSESIRGDAEAINRAGSLRMQSYRLATHLGTSEQSPFRINLPQPGQLETLVDEFNRAIDANALHRAIKGNERLIELYQQASTRWHTLMRPLIEQQPPQRRAFNFEIPLFVELLDDFVHELQLASERKLSYIRAFQISSLFITVLTAFVITISSHNQLVIPLQKLIGLARRIGKGNFEGRANLTAHNELGLLAQTLDTMSVELSGLYRNLEDKVETKAAELRQSNSNLALLFDTAKRLYKTTDDPIPAIAELLDSIRDTLGVQSVSICLFQTDDATGQQAHTILSTEPDGQPAYCVSPNCGNCLMFDGERIPQPMHTFDIQAESITFGTLHVLADSAAPLEDWQIQIFTTLADFFAVALNLNKLGGRQARIALMEERAVIARELHDSLAQALSYQKIQLALLKKQLSADYPREAVEATISGIQGGLSAAYLHLRELLSTFRMKLDKPGLAAGIKATLEEFSRYSGLQLSLNYELGHCPLTPNEEIHCLQIIREALSNVIKHANAHHCSVTLYQDPRGMAHIQIDDDGIGFDSERDFSGHYGLSILKERTGSLAGSMNILTRHPGTRIHVQFMPAYTYGQRRTTTS